jgi:2-polyprenyl-3-methyl-5-hydroxy-6-metoxy-1,4-benzoquinol methylase
MNPFSSFFRISRIRYLRWRKRNLWERQWRTPNFQPLWLTNTPRPFIISSFEKGWLAPSTTVLEIGCGRGAAAAWLAERGLRVVAIDVSNHVIEQARETYANQAGLEFRCVDVCAPTDMLTVFDVILDTGCLQHIPRSLRDDYCRNLLTWSRTGSRFVVTMHKKDCSASDRLTEVLDMFSANFDLAHAEEVRPANPNVKHLNSVFHFVRR